MSDSYVAAPLKLLLLRVKSPHLQRAPHLRFVDLHAYTVSPLSQATTLLISVKRFSSVISKSRRMCLQTAVYRSHCFLSCALSLSSQYARCRFRHPNAAFSARRKAKSFCGSAPSHSVSNLACSASCTRSQAPLSTWANSSSNSSWRRRSFSCWRFMITLTRYLSEFLLRS